MQRQPPSPAAPHGPGPAASAPCADDERLYAQMDAAYAQLQAALSPELLDAVSRYANATETLMARSWIKDHARVVEGLAAYFPAVGPALLVVASYLLSSSGEEARPTDTWETVQARIPA